MHHAPAEAAVFRIPVVLYSGGRNFDEAAPPGTNFLVVSDHGIIPAHTTLLVNNYLARAGFKVSPAEGAEVRAYTDGPSANIYVNVKGKRKGGIVPAERLKDYVERIVAACKSLRDPVSGEPVFEVVLRGDELDTVGLKHPERSGDVFVSARPGWVLSPRISPALPFFVPTTLNPDTRSTLDKAAQEFLEAGGVNEVGLGVHGYLGRFREIQSIFFAVGPDVPHAALGVVRAIDVAPTAAALLGIEPPRDAQGRSVLSLKP
jgi:hypothetical protein